MFTARNALHKVELEQQRFHALHIQPGGVVSVVFISVGALRQALIVLFHELGVIQIAAMGDSAMRI